MGRWIDFGGEGIMTISCKGYVSGVIGKGLNIKYIEDKLCEIIYDVEEDGNIKLKEVIELTEREVKETERK